MTIGIGGAGCKLAVELDNDAVLVNVSEVELNKVQGGSERILATVRAEHGQFRGSRKNPEIGHDAYESIKRELQVAIRGNKVFSSTGGGTGNGITSGILDDLAKAENVSTQDKTFFGIVLPYADMESSEFVDNTIDFLTGPLTDAIDSGNTGNIVLFSNKDKFENEIAEDEFNTKLIDSLKVFLAIPDKNEMYRLRDGHIDHEDFALYISKPYFNYFTSFDYEPSKDFEAQLDANVNTLLLEPDEPLEAMFLLEIPQGGDPTIFYSILRYFNGKEVTPIYSVIENPSLKKPFITVSLLYSRKPDELLEDFNRISEHHAQVKVKKSLDQYKPMPKLAVNMEDEAKKAVSRRTDVQEDVLATLRRIGKL